SVQGLTPRFPDRLIVAQALTFEAIATALGVVHYLGVPAGKGDLVIGQLRAAIPGLRAVREEAAPTRHADKACEWSAIGTGSLLTETIPESNAALLATLQPLKAGEAVVVQWA